MRLMITVVIAAVGAALVLLFVGSLGQISPGNPFVAAAIGLVLLLVAVGAFRGLVRHRSPEVREEAEDVAGLEVFFVCGECGTEFRVEKLGELQVPRHCGEPMRVERRAHGAPAGTG
jgi:hypothetical protein